MSEILAGQEHIILDAMPDDVLSTIEVRDKHTAEVGLFGGFGCSGGFPVK